MQCSLFTIQTSDKPLGKSLMTNPTLHNSNQWDSLLRNTPPEDRTRCFKKIWRLSTHDWEAFHRLYKPVVADCFMIFILHLIQKGEYDAFNNFYFSLDILKTLSDTIQDRSKRRKKNINIDYQLKVAYGSGQTKWMHYLYQLALSNHYVGSYAHCIMIPVFGKAGRLSEARTAFEAVLSMKSLPKRFYSNAFRCMMNVCYHHKKNDELKALYEEAESRGLMSPPMDNIMRWAFPDYKPPERQTVTAPPPTRANTPPIQKVDGYTLGLFYKAEGFGIWAPQPQTMEAAWEQTHPASRIPHRPG